MPYESMPQATQNPVYYALYRDEVGVTIVAIGWSADAVTEITFWSNGCLTLERKTGEAGEDPEDFVELDPPTILVLQALLNKPEVQSRR
jgi:hypothetical protein